MITKLLPKFWLEKKSTNNFADHMQQHGDLEKNSTSRNGSEKPPTEFFLNFCVRTNYNKSSRKGQKFAAHFQHVQRFMPIGQMMLFR